MPSRVSLCAARPANDNTRCPIGAWALAGLLALAAVVVVPLAIVAGMR